MNLGHGGNVEEIKRIYGLKKKVKLLIFQLI